MLMPDYAYNLVVETGTITVEALEGSTDHVSEVMGHALAPLAMNLSAQLANLPPGGWEVVSHDLQVLGENHVLTFLVRRET